MLNADDPQTITSLLLLREVCLSDSKPLVFWIGAGASRWLNYPTWKETALAFRSDFFGIYRQSFDNARAITSLNAEDYPAVFQLCRDLDQARYYRILAEKFGPRASTPLYVNFLTHLRRFRPLSVITTNIDEALESWIPECALVQRSDLGRINGLLRDKKPFIGKLHGTVSAIGSVVFATDDYERLVADSSYIHALDTLFSTSTVIFLGYGLRDQYLIELLTKNYKDFSLFGAGPHFTVTTCPPRATSLRPIGYHISLHPDHRAALTVLSYMQQTIDSKSAHSTVMYPRTPSGGSRISLGRSAYYISDVVPPGTWQTSQLATAQNEDGLKVNVTIGLGFTNDEVPFLASTAMHDLAVGLTCFDVLCFPLSAVGAVHQVLGSELFWRLVDSDVLQFIHLVHIPSVMTHPEEVLGDLGIISIQTDVEYGGDTRRGLIQRHLKAMPGKEAEAAALFDKLNKKTIIYDQSENINLPSLVRGALLMPAVSKLLGISDAILPTQVPKWLVFPYLRLAHLVQTSAVCSAFDFQATKLPFGGVQLTSAAFNVQPAQQYAEEFASYIYSGRFNNDLGALILKDLNLVNNILRFRESSAGESFRREIRDTLVEGDGTQFTASVNAGLDRSLPPDVLSRAYDQLSMLMTKDVRNAVVPAIWSEAIRSDSFTHYWRQKSFRTLLELCRAADIGKNDPCICGSGEKLRLCCLHPLRN